MQLPTKRSIKNRIKCALVVLIVLSSIKGFSQEINFGAKAGLNIASLRGDYPNGIDEKRPIIGFHIGGFAEYMIIKEIGIQPEVLFSRQGVTTKIDQNGASLTQAQRLNYLNLALIGKYAILEKLSIEFGPQIGYTLTAKSKWEYEDSNDPSRNESVELDLLNGGTVIFLGDTIEGEGRINKLDFGLNLGASYDLTETILVQARYYHGLSIVDKNSTTSTSTDSWNLKNSVLQFSIAYKF